MDGTHGIGGDGQDHAQVNARDAGDAGVRSLLERLANEVGELARTVMGLRAQIDSTPAGPRGRRAAPVQTAAGASERAAPVRTDDELRAKLAGLPVRMSTARPANERRGDAIPGTPEDSDYRFPALDLLDEPVVDDPRARAAIAQEQALLLARTLEQHLIPAEIAGIDCGPAVTVYSVELEDGTSATRLKSIAGDIARALRVPAVRIDAASRRGGSACIEVPNATREVVRLRELIAGGGAEDMALPMFLGKDTGGEPVVLDLAQMPHMLIAGTTGSGKSVCLNSIVMSLLYTKRPDELKLVLIDPKMVDLAMFDGIAHLACPVVTEMRKAAAILAWAVVKVEERLEQLKYAGVRDIHAYNSLGEDELRARLERDGEIDEVEWARVPKRIPSMVFVIDGLADLVAVDPDVEQSILRIAEKSRAAGMHLVITTQSPRAKVIGTQLRSNLPCRVVFRTATEADSRAALDRRGAEFLLGEGDMLVVTPGRNDARRCQCTFVDDREMCRAVGHIRSVAPASPDRVLLAAPVRNPGARQEPGVDAATAHTQDELFDKAVEIMIETGRGSVSLLQRRLALGYGRASRLVELMGQAGLLGEHKGSLAREVVVTMEEWLRMKAMRDYPRHEGTAPGAPSVNSGTDIDSDALRLGDEDKHVGDDHGDESRGTYAPDELFDQAAEILIASGRGSVSLLVRRLAISRDRASRLVDLMAQAGLLGEYNGSSPREVVVTMEEWTRMKAMRDQAQRDGTIFGDAE